LTTDWGGYYSNAREIPSSELENFSYTWESIEGGKDWSIVLWCSWCKNCWKKIRRNNNLSTTKKKEIFICSNEGNIIGRDKRLSLDI